MNEDILGAILGADEAETLLGGLFTIRNGEVLHGRSGRRTTRRGGANNET